MKPLNEMSNIDKGYMLAKMFPANLKDIRLYAIQLIELYQSKSEQIRSIWTNSIITVEFWYEVLNGFEGTIKRFNVSLDKSPRIFADQLFYAYNAMFMIDCLIEYAGTEDCDSDLAKVIELLFGIEKMFLTSLANEQS